MINLNHREFDPGFNRIYNQPVSTLHPRVEQTEVDHNDPYRPIHTGVYTGQVDGREYVFCVPSTVKPSGNTVFVFGSAGQTAQQLFDEGNWRDALETHEAAGCFVVPDGDWDRENPGDVMDWFLKVYAQMRDLEYYASNLDSIYTIGLGTGAYPAALYASLYSTIVAACVVGGVNHIAPELLEQIGKLPSDGDPYVLKNANPLPAWVLDGDGSGKHVAEYFKAAVGIQEEHLRNDVARVWKQQPKPGTLYLNEQPVSEVWYSDPAQTAALSPAEFADRALAFVTGYRRWGGVKNRHLRRAKSPEEMGLIRREITIDGRKRHWYVYEPSAYKNRTKEQYPMVLAIHGYSCSGPFFAENSSWEAVAEERGFIVAFPTGYPYLRTWFHGNRSYAGPAPAWNPTPDINVNPGAQDDVKFLCELVDIMQRDYPIDKTRTYVSGHSNGSATTQALLRYAPERFAGFAPIGGVEAAYRPELLPLPGDVVRPVWYIMGEHDRDGCTVDAGNHNDRTIRNACRTNGVDWDDHRHYTSGLYEHYVGYTKDHEPLVRFTGIMDWPHTVTPETSLLIYDEFFSKLSREPDGTIKYWG